MNESLARKPSAPTSWQRLLHRHGALLVVLMALVVSFASVANHELWTPDEPREAQIGREMLEAGFTATPTLSGEPFVEKPPLFPWAMAASYAVFGTSAAAARVPAALFSTLSVLLAFYIGRRLAGSAAGVAAAVVLLTTSKFATTSVTAVNDTALTAFVAGGHLCFVVARDHPRRTMPLLLGGLCAAAAFMAKGIIGPLLVFGPPAMALAALREWRTLGAIAWRGLLFCAVPVVATAAAWVFALARESGWDVVRESLVNNTVGRTLGGSGKDFGTYGHSKPFWYYVHAFPIALLPWSLALPAMWSSRILDRGARPQRTRFVAALVICGIVLLSIPAGKRTLYFMPLLPATAAVFGVWLARIGSSSGSRLDRGTLVVLTGLLAAACAGAAVVVGRVAVSGAPLEKPVWIADTPGLWAVAALAAAGAVTASALARRAFARSDWRLVRMALTFAVVIAAVTSAVGRPLLDPAKEMRTGALAIASHVSSPDRIVGVRLGETAEAVLAFYPGRRVRNLAHLAQVDQLVAQTGLREFVIEDRGRTADLVRTARARFDELARVELKSGDFVIVFGVRASEAK